MARKLMPKSGILMPYVVANRDAQVSGVSFVDGEAGNVDLSNKYLKIVDAQTQFAMADKSYSKTESDGRYLQSHNIKVGYRVPIKSAGIPQPDLVSGTTPDSMEIELIKAAEFTTLQDTNGVGTPGIKSDNHIIIGDLDAGISGVHIYSEGRTDVVYKNDNNELRTAPLYSQRYRPEIQDMPFAAIGSYVKDSKGRTIGVDKSSGINTDIKVLNGLTTISNPVAIAPATADTHAVTRAQAVAIAIANGGGGNGATLNGVMNDFLGAVEWWNGSRDAPPAGYLAADGQALPRADYPDLWNAVNSHLLNSVSDEDWYRGVDNFGSPMHRGKYSFGLADNSSQYFRLPDLNGATKESGTKGQPDYIPASLSHVYLSALGVGSVNQSGHIGASGAPDITGRFTTSDIGSQGDNGGSDPNANTTLTGAFGINGGNFGDPSQRRPWTFFRGSSPDATGIEYNVEFKASRSNPVYGRSGSDDIYPNTAYGCWIIRVKGAFEAAETNFNVITSSAIAPTAGAAIHGGDIKSVYKAAGSEYASATFSLGGTTTDKKAVIDIKDSVGSKTWQFGADGKVTTPAGALNVTGTISATAAASFGPTTINGNFTVSSLATLNNNVNIPNGVLNVTNYANFGSLHISTNKAAVSGNQGGWLVWNEDGVGATSLINNQGSGTGGFQVRNVNNANNVETSNMFFSGSDGSLKLVARGSANTQEGTFTITPVRTHGIKFPTNVGTPWGSAGQVPGAGLNNYLEFNVDGQALGIPYFTSDIRYKENIKDVKKGEALKVIDNIQPRSYDWKNKGYHEDFGVIAQELEKAYPQGVNTLSDGYKELNPSALIGLLLATVKDLKSELDSVKDRVAELEAKQE